MSEGLIAVAIFAVAASVALVHACRVRQRQRLAVEKRFSPQERREIGRVFPLFNRLPGDLRDRLEGLMHLFLEEKSFEACGGLAAVSGEMRRAIAAQACLLVVANNRPVYPELRSVLIYPDAYRVRDEWGDEEVRLGESWQSGSVVLAWSQVRSGGLDPEDGLNVTLHEFAHQLDQASGGADGLPELDDWQGCGTWAQACGAAYEQFCEDLRRGRKTVMDPYGASDPAEFFAVATETFFERPAELARDLPELFGELKMFYNLDPRDWAEAIEAE